MTRKRDGGYRLPVNPTTENRRCVMVNIPDDLTHIANFWGTLHSLSRASNYDASRLQDSYLAADMWRAIIEDARLLDCTGGSMDCNDIIACLSDQPQWQAGEVQAASDFYMTDAELQNKTNEQVNARATAYDGTPQSIMTDAVNDKFGNWGQNSGWYEAVTAFVQASFAAKIRQINQMNGVITVAQILFQGLKTLSGGGWILNAAGLTLLPLDLLLTYGGQAFINLLNDPMILYHTIDGIARENGNKAVSRAGFTALTANGYAWRDTTYMGMATIKQWLNAEILNHPIQGDKNYLLMLQAVHTANHHKTVLGDPMWDGRNNKWTLIRGKNYSINGVQVPIGSVNTTTGFICHTNGINRELDIILTSPNKTNYDKFNLTGASATLSPIRPTSLKVLNDGVEEYSNTNNYPYTSNYYYGMNAYGQYLHFNGHYEESGQWTLTDPLTFDLLTVNGFDKPPVGYWTPD